MVKLDYNEYSWYKISRIVKGEKVIDIQLQNISEGIYGFTINPIERSRRVWAKTLDGDGHYVQSKVHAIVDSVQKHKSGVLLQGVIITDTAIKKPTQRAAYKVAANLGYGNKACKAELAYYLRMGISNAKLAEIGAQRIIVSHEPITFGGTSYQLGITSEYSVSGIFPYWAITSDAPWQSPRGKCPDLNDTVFAFVM